MIDRLQSCRGDRRIERTLSERGIYCSLIAVTPRFLAEKEYLRFCRSKMFDGFLLWDMTERETFVHELAEENPPVVSIQGVKNNPKLSGVNADDYRGMCDLVRRVLDCGHRRIGVIPALESSQAGRERNRGRPRRAGKGGVPVSLLGGRRLRPADRHGGIPRADEAGRFDQLHRLR